LGVAIRPGGAVGVVTVEVTYRPDISVRRLRARATGFSIPIKAITYFVTAILKRSHLKTNARIHACLAKRALQLGVYGVKAHFSPLLNVMISLVVPWATVICGYYCCQPFRLDFSQYLTAASPRIIDDLI
jgi:hypothetical protein